MPNWANVTYKISGDKKQIDKLDKIIEELQSNEEPIVPNGFGNLWLGCIVTKLGGDWNKVYCRGSVYDTDREGDVLTLNQETAWGEMEEFRHFLESVLPGIEIYYYVEESGMGVYETNDSSGIYFSDRYLIEGGNDCYESYKDIESAAKHIERIVGRHVDPDIESIEEAVEEYNIDIGEDSDDCIYFNEIQVVGC